MKLTLYVDPAWRRPLTHTPLLFPFWGNALSEKTPYQKALFDRYSFDTKHYDVTSNPQMADMVLLPYRHAVALKRAPELIAECDQRAKVLRLPLLIDGTGDIEYPITLENTIVLRVGGYRFEREKNVIIIPPYADDLLEVSGKKHITVRSKQLKPVIGFMGWASVSPVQEIRTRIKDIPVSISGLFNANMRTKRKGIFFRQRALRALMRSPSVKNTFTIRSSYSGHMETASLPPEVMRAQYIENLLDSDYGLDVRGDANASQRLFEILSLGRIPVIVDTQRNFPFSEHLDYSKFSFMIDFREIDQLPMKLARFHANLLDDEFKEMQKTARYAFRHFFRVDALIEHIVQEIRDRINLS